VNSSNSTGGTSSFSTSSVKNLFDKDNTTGVTFTYGDTTGIIYAYFNAPVLIDRIFAVTGGLGNIPAGTLVKTEDTQGQLETVLNTSGASSEGFDTDNFKPVPVQGVRIEFTADAAIAELVIQKVTEVKAYSQSVDLVEYYGQQVYFDPLVAGENEYDYLLMRIPLEVDDDDDPTQNLDSTTASFSETEEDSERISVQFHVPHTDLASISDYVRCKCTVEASANAHVSDVRFTIYKRDMVTDTLTTLVPEETITDPAAGDVCDAEEIRRITANIQGTDEHPIDIDEVLVVRIRVFGAQDSSSATSSWVTLHHTRGSADFKVGVPTVPR